MKRLLIGFIACCSLYAKADDYHHKNLLVGTNAIGYGGAFTAISNDLSAVFYNPAGVSLSSDSNSASISTFAFEQTDFENIFSTGEDLTRSSFSIVPSFLGMGGQFKDYKWSLALAVPDLSSERTYASASYEIPNEFGSMTQATEFAYIDLDYAVYSLALGAATHFNDTTSVGFSVIANYKNVVTAQGSGINYNTVISDTAIANGFEAARRIDDQRLTVTTSLGFLVHNEIADFGFKVSKEFNVSRDFKSTHSIITNLPIPLPPGAVASSVGTIKSSKQQEYPTLISLGLAKSISAFTISFDIDHYRPVDVEEFQLSVDEPTITRDYKELNNLSLGIAYKAQSGSTYKLGLFTDKANLEIDTTQQFQRAEAIDLIGLSMSVDMKLFDYPISFGGYIKYGTGQVRVADIRSAEQIVGLSLYPNTNNFDTSEATKRAFITYVSANF